MTLANISSKGATKYYFSASGEYYEKDANFSQWHGKMAFTLGLSEKSVSLDDFDKLIKGFSLDGEKLVKNAGMQNHRGGSDLTFSAPKSLSLLSLHDDALIKAHQNSVEKALDYVEKNYVQTRVTDPEMKTPINTRTEKALFATFDHHSNRNLEPQLHTHCVLFNITQDSNNKFKTTHNDLIYVDQNKLGMIYRTELAREVLELGYNIDVVDRSKGLFEIASISKEIRETFSGRRQAVLTKAKELAESMPWIRDEKIKEMAAVSSRLKKKGNISKENLLESVNEVLAKDGTSLEKIAQDSKSEKRIMSDQSLESTIFNAVAGIEENHSAWRKEELIDHVAKISLGKFTSKEITNAVDQSIYNKEILKSGEKVSLKGNLSYYSSPEMKEVEKKIINLAKEGKDQSQINIEQDSFNKFKAQNQLKINGLTPSQKETLDFVASSKDQFLGIQGDAGTGKTFVMNIAREIYEKNGHFVRGMAPTGKATHELSENSGIKTTSTVDSFLLSGKNEIKKGKELWIIDESGMLGSRKVEKIMSLAKDNRAKVIFLGDVKQFSSIEQGLVFRDLQNQSAIKFAQMTDLIRQKNETFKNVVKHLNDFKRKGDDKAELTKAFELLITSGAIVASPDAQTRQEQIKSEYLGSFKKNENILVIADKNDEKKQLNDVIRSELVKDGLIKEGKEFKILVSLGLSGKSSMYAGSYQEGQHVFFQEKFGKIKKGTWSKIVDVDSNKNTIKLESKGIFGAKQALIDLSYAGTGKTIQTFAEEKRHFSAGDQIIFNKNDKKIDVRNGELGKITSIDSSGVIKAQINNSNKAVTFSMTDSGDLHYPYIDHAYAVTTYKSQGASIDKVIFSASSEKINFKSFYVAGTRIKHTIKIFTDNIGNFMKNAGRDEGKVSSLEFDKDLIDFEKSADKSNQKQEAITEISKTESKQESKDLGQELTI